MLEVDLHPGRGPVAFHIENHTLAELAMANAPAQSHPGPGSLLGPHPHRRNWARNLDTRPYFLDEFLRYFLDESRRYSVAVNTVKAALLRVSQKELLHCSCHADVTQAPLFLETIDVIQRALMGEQAVLHAAEEHHR